MNVIVKQINYGWIKEEKFTKNTLLIKMRLTKRRSYKNDDKDKSYKDDDLAKIRPKIYCF